jgi:hypothetical protein
MTSEREDEPGESTPEATPEDKSPSSAGAAALARARQGSVPVTRAELNPAAQTAQEVDKKLAIEMQNAHIDASWLKMQQLSEEREAEEAANPTMHHAYPNQRFATGAAVYVLRSSGAESLAYVTDYSPISGVYEVELDRCGSELFKQCMEDTMRASAAPPAPNTPRAADGARVAQQHAIGAKVYVRRSDGSESIAYVREYEGSKGVYTLELEKGKAKQALAKHMRPCPEGDGPMSELLSAMGAPPTVGQPAAGARPQPQTFPMAPTAPAAQQAVASPFAVQPASASGPLTLARSLSSERASRSSNHRSTHYSASTNPRGQIRHSTHNGGHWGLVCSRDAVWCGVVWCCPKSRLDDVHKSTSLLRPERGQ